MKKVYLIIVNYNSSEITKDCLVSLNELKKNGIDLAVIVADNSTEGKFSLDKNKYKNLNVELIDSGGNRGFTGGVNLGLKRALEKGADYVILLNNDTKADENLVQELVKAAEDKEVGVIVPKIYYAKGSEYHKDRYSLSELGKVIWYAGGYIDWGNAVPKHTGVDEVDKGQFEKEKDVSFATGCCMLLTKELIEDIGILDDRYFLYYEDADLSKRATEAGFRIIFSPKAVIWHRNAASSGGSGSKIQDYFVSRNRMYFGMKYAPLKTKVALVRESMRLLLNGRQMQKKGITDYYKKNMGKGIL